MVATLTKETGASPVTDLAPIDRSLVAEASSAHSRINIPLNLDNWKSYPQHIQDELLWFHQWILSKNIGWKEAKEAIGYDQTTIFKVLKGMYTGSMEKVARAIHSFRELEEKRGRIKRHEFCRTPISDIVFGALDYALANNTMTMIVGDARVGKSVAAGQWSIVHNHGRAVPVTAPAVGGAKGFLRRIATQVGVNKSQPAADMSDAIFRAFNPNRILIVDQAHWLLPSDPRSSNPGGLNFLIDLYEAKRCAIALLSTKRLPERFEQGAFLYEQIIGRVGQPVLIPSKLNRGDVLPIVRQFVKTPGNELLEILEKMANAPGRLGVVVETLKVASRIASVDKEPLSEKHVMMAIAMRTQHSREGK